MYPIADYTLRFADSFTILEVVRKSDDGVEESFDLTNETPFLNVCVVDGEYQIGSEDCDECEEFCALDVEYSGGTATFDGTKLGINVVDLRDTGRSGTWTADLECGPVSFCRMSGPWALVFLSLDGTCYTQS